MRHKRKWISPPSHLSQHKYFSIDSSSNHPTSSSIKDLLDHFSMATKKSNVLLIGSGGVGTIAAVNLEAGGLASVTAVLRSNFKKVQKDGFSIKSCDHGVIKGWKPSEGYHKYFILFFSS